MESRKWRVLSKIPVLFTVALDLVSIFTGWVFAIDAEDHYIYGPLFLIQAIGCYIYLLVPTYWSLRRALQTHVKSKRRECLIYASYMIPSLAAGLVEDLIPAVPLLYLSMFMVILILFLTIQDAQISTDALTGLNNRRRLEWFLKGKLATASPEKPVHVFMIDVDRFKTINDTFGHVKGDAALCVVAESLKITAAQYGAFVARYGGDEFCFIVDQGVHTPDEIQRRLRAALDESQEKMLPDKEYTLTISIGHYECCVPETDIRKVIQQADKVLYREKHKNQNDNLMRAK